MEVLKKGVVLGGSGAKGAQKIGKVLLLQL